MSETDNHPRQRLGTVPVTLAIVPDAHALVFREEPTDPKTAISGCPGYVPLSHASFTDLL